jgi:hypothetical protein
MFFTDRLAASALAAILVFDGEFGLMAFNFNSLKFLFLRLVYFKIYLLHGGGGRGGKKGQKATKKKQ